MRDEKPVARGGGRDLRAPGRAGEIFHRPELAPGRQRRARRYLQFRHQARSVRRRMPRYPGRRWRPAPRSRGKYPERHPQRRQQHWRILFRCRNEQLPASRYRHEDDPPRKNTRSTIVSKESQAGAVRNSYRGLVKSARKPTTPGTSPNAIRATWRSLRGHTFPYLEVHNKECESRARGDDLPKSARTRSSVPTSVAFPPKMPSASS